MADTKISALTAASAALGADELAINEAGTSKKLTVAQIAAFIGGGMTLFVAANDATAKEKASADYLCDGTADDVQINAAAVALPSAGGTIRLSTGTFSAAAMIDLHLTKQVNLVGSGWATKITAASDFGAYLTDTGDGASNMLYHSTIKDLYLSGGASNTAIGGTPRTIRAIRTRAKTVLENIYIDGGFHSGISMDGDHISVSYVRGGGIQYGVYCPSGQATFGDATFFRCVFVACSLASVGVQDGGDCQSLTFLESKLGFSPYGFYREPGSSSALFMDACRLIGTNIESYGNAAIYDNSGGASTTFRDNDLDSSFSQDDTYKYATHGLRAAIIVVPVMLWNRIALGDIAVNTGFLPGTEGYIKASNTAYNNVVVATIGSYGSSNLFDKVATAGLPFWVNASVWNRTNIFIEGNMVQSSQFAAETFGTFSTLLRNQCVENDDGVDDVTQAAGSNPIMGVALHATGGAARVAVQTYGIGHVIVNGTVVAGDPLKADSGSAGRVIKSTAPGTDRILGWARGSASAGATVECFINPSNW